MTEIQALGLLLFECDVTDPFNLGRYGCVECKMLTDKVLEELTVYGSSLQLRAGGRVGFTYEISHGGEDTSVGYTFGEVLYKYTVSFDLPSHDQTVIERIMGGEFSALIERPRLGRLAIFDNLVAKKTKFDNGTVQRVTLESQWVPGKMYEVQNLNLNPPANEILTKCKEKKSNGFDYIFDAPLN